MAAPALVPADEEDALEALLFHSSPLVTRATHSSLLLSFLTPSTMTYTYTFVRQEDGASLRIRQIESGCSRENRFRWARVGEDLWTLLFHAVDGVTMPNGEPLQCLVSRETLDSGAVRWTISSSGQMRVMKACFTTDGGAMELGLESTMRADDLRVFLRTRTGDAKDVQLHLETYGSEVVSQAPYVILRTTPVERTEWELEQRRRRRTGEKKALPRAATARDRHGRATQPRPAAAEPNTAL
jgi:hypothetical protein